MAIPNRICSWQASILALAALAPGATDQAFAAPLAAQATAPRLTSAATRLRAYVSAYNRNDAKALSDFLLANFSAEALGDKTPEERAALIIRTREFTGQLRLHSVKTSVENHAAALLQSTVTEEWFALDIETSSKPPHSVVKQTMDFTAPPPDAIETAPINDTGIATEIRRFAEQLYRHSAFKGAVSIALDDRPLIEWSSPSTSDESKRADALLSVASTGKLFTIIAIAQLEQGGRLSLGDPIGKILTDYPNRDAAENVTIGHLLTHSSGIPDYMDDPAYQKAKNAAGGRLATTADYLPFFAAAPLKFRPGSESSYSNSGYAVLGLIVERLSRTPFPAYVIRRIFRPAGMTETSLDTIRPAGGEMSTVSDLVLFGRAVRHRLLSAAQARRVLSPILANENANAYGLEVVTEGKATSLGHGGGAPGIGARLDLYPDSGHYVAILVEGDDAATRRIADKARRLIARRVSPPVRSQPRKAR